MEYIYDETALRKIRLALKFKKVRIPNAIGVHVNTYSAWEKGGRMNMVDIIKISNYLRISPSAFFRTSRGPVNFDQTNVEDFKPCVFNTSHIEHYLRGVMKYTVAEICEKAGISMRSYYIYFPKSDKGSVMFVDRFVNICNKFKLWPGMFLTERGTEIEKLDGYACPEYIPALEHDASYLHLSTGEYIDNKDVKEYIHTIYKLSERIQHLETIINQQRQLIHTLTSGKYIYDTGEEQTSLVAEETSSSIIPEDDGYTVTV